LAASVGQSFSSCVSIQVSFYDSLERFEASLRYIISTYASHPNYLKLQNKPVIFFDNIARVPNGGTIKNWRDIRSRVDPNNEQIWIAEGLEFSYLTVFDGLYVMKISHRDYPNDYLKLPRWGNQVRQMAYQSGQPKLWIATIMPGWDDTRTADKVGDLRDFSPPHEHDRGKGTYYRQTFEKALESRPDILYINSWDEWVEGTQIEPSVNYENRYLEITRELIARFKAS